MELLLENIIYSHYRTIHTPNKTKKDDEEDNPVDIGDSSSVGGLLDGAEDD